MNDQLLLKARAIFDSHTSWVAAFRDVFGLDGLLRSTLTTGELADFLRSAGYGELLELLTELRSTDRTQPTQVEPERMITIRIPRSLHDVLIWECRSAKLSLNKLAISKLLQPLDPRLTPLQQGRKRGRRFKVDEENGNDAVDRSSPSSSGAGQVRSAVSVESNAGQCPQRDHRCRTV